MLLRSNRLVFQFAAVVFVIATMNQGKALASFAPTSPIVTGNAGTVSLPHTGNAGIYSASENSSLGTASAEVDLTQNHAPGVFASATGLDYAEAQVKEFDTIQITGIGSTTIDFAPTWAGTFQGAGKFFESITVNDITHSQSATDSVTYGDGSNTYTGPAALNGVFGGDTLELSFLSNASTVGAGVVNVLDPASVYIYDLEPGFSEDSASGYNYLNPVANGFIGAPTPEPSSLLALMAMLGGGAALFALNSRRARS